MAKDVTKLVQIFKQEGTSGSDRYAPALNPQTVKLDDRQPEDFIIYAQQYAKNFLFVDTDPAVTDFGPWEDFFKDGSVLLSANIATKDIAEVKKAYDVLFDAFSKEQTTETFSRLLQYVFSRFKKIDDWYASSVPGSSLQQDLYLYIKSYLARELRNLTGIISYINAISGEGAAVNTELINKNNVWEIAIQRETSLGKHVFTGSSDREKLNSALLFTNKIFDVVLHATEIVIKGASVSFRETIYEHQTLPPHIALYLTFVHLFSEAQKELNRLPARLLDFYYNEVLQIKAREAVPDTAFVLFDIAKGFDTYRIGKGTKLLGGKDKNKRDIVYTTDKELVLNKAVADTIKTIFIEKKEGLIAGYYGQVIRQAGEKVADGLWKTFGEIAQERELSTGFAIASTQLYLAKGERSITILFDVAAELAPGWESFDLSLIELQLTGEKGWISSWAQDNIVIQHFIKTDSGRLELSFTISTAQPSAVVAFDEKIHTRGFTTNMPVLLLLLRRPPSAAIEAQTAESKLLLQQLNFLYSISVVRTTIRVQVGTISQKASFDGVRELDIENHETALDPKKPFYPFTSLPKVGSSLYIGCNDLYYKKIQNLSVNIQWMLPDNFRSYYDKYFPPYDSNKFMASLSVLKDQKWNKISDVPLIDTASAQPGLRVIRVPGSPAEDVPGEVSKFSNGKPNGTIKLKLNYPDFGHDIYPQLLTSAVMEKAVSKSANVDFYKIVKGVLKDSVLSIKVPPAGSPGYSTAPVLTALKNVESTDQQKVMIREVLNDLLVRFNGIDNLAAEAEGRTGGQAVTLVNDNNFIERILRFLKKVKLIDKKIHYDQDKDSVDDVVESVNAQINTRADFILPADQEMIALIAGEVNHAINRIVAKSADKIIDANKKAPVPEADILGMVVKEVTDANEVINDMVAGKIATLLLAHDIPPKPYTPLINSIAISYTSSKELVQGEDKFFQLHPFGFAETGAFGAAQPLPNRNAGSTNSPVPAVSSGIFALEAMPGSMLCIGLEHLQGGQNLTLLFQMDQSSTLSDKKPPAVQWWYLRNNTWIPLSNDVIISDSTYGLQTSGIVEISVPAGINNGNTVFAERDLCWLCASVAGGTETFPHITGIDTQAVSVTFEDQGNELSHLESSLPAQKITRLQEPMPGIKAIRQPMASFKGKIKEAAPEFYVRVSERLRHKERAVNNWDYERIVLENFPFVYKVKCINNYVKGAFVPGHVTVVPIINLKNKSSYQLPKASYLELRRIEELLQRKATAFCRIHAINPQINYLKVTGKVQFHTGVDKGFYLKRLNEELVQFLTPWADEANRLSFSAKVYASTIINFIDKKEYVDFVADLSINQFTVTEDNKTEYFRLENGSVSLSETQVANAHSILVSVAEHDLELV